MAIDDTPKRLRIAVVGGGPGGLATAIALQQISRVDVKIYEKASVLREVGAGINIGQNTWNVLDLLGVADSLTSGHHATTVLNMNGKTGEELHRVDRDEASFKRPTIRTQRTKLHSALLSHVADEIINLKKELVGVSDLGDAVQLKFSDGTKTVVDLVVGADGIRSVVRDSAWQDYDLKFTGTTIWRVLLPITAIADLDPRFLVTCWWHSPTTHVYFSPVGEGMWEIAARAWQDPKVHSASKVSWGTPVTNEVVESHFADMLPQIREALSRVPKGAWKEFAAFAGPELPDLTNWNNKIVLVGDSSHALTGAFGSGAGFAIEDGWVLARALEATENDLQQALPIFNQIRLPYYSRMYAHLEGEAKKRAAKLSAITEPSYDDRVRNKIIKPGGQDMAWIYANNIGHVWEKSRAEFAASRSLSVEV